MPQCFIYFRSWTGFTNKFPYFRELNSLADEQIHDALTARAREWLTFNKQAVKSKYRQEKSRLKEAIRNQERQVLQRPRGVVAPSYHRNTSRDREQSFRAMFFERFRGPRRRPLIQRIGRIAGWYDGMAINGISAPTPKLFLGSVPNEQLATEIGMSLGNYMKRLDEEAPWQIHFGFVFLDSISKAEAARVELEIDELPSKKDELSQLHLAILNYYRKLVQKVNSNAPKISSAEPSLSSDVNNSATVSAMPQARASDALYIQERNARLRRDRDRLLVVLRELDYQWNENAEYPTFMSSWGLTAEAAELSAAMGFACPPIERTSIWRAAPVIHDLFASNPDWECVHLIRVREPSGLALIELPLGAFAKRVEGTNLPPVKIEIQPEKLKGAKGFIKSWRRMVEAISVEAIRHSVMHYPDRRDSPEIMAFASRLWRELNGKGDPSLEEEQETLRTSLEMKTLGAEQLCRESSKEFQAKYRIAAQFAPTPGVNTSEPESTPKPMANGNESPDWVDDTVTLEQAAALAKMSKRSLERYLQKGMLPAPDFPGGGGKAHKWKWSVLREPLAKIANRPLPERFPGSRLI